MRFLVLSEERWALWETGGGLTNHDSSRCTLWARRRAPRGALRTQGMASWVKLVIAYFCKLNFHCSSREHKCPHRVKGWLDHTLNRERGRRRAYRHSKRIECSQASIRNKWSQSREHSETAWSWRLSLREGLARKSRNTSRHQNRHRKWESSLRADWQSRKNNSRRAVS